MSIALSNSLCRKYEEEGHETEFGIPRSLQNRWMPYVNNGGSVVAVAMDDYVIVAGDTRMSIGFSIYTRKSSKIAKLTEKCYLATAGMNADSEALYRLLKAKVKLYEHKHGKAPSVNAVAQLLSTILYYKRFFPYYTFNLIVGIDEQGKGVVYGYDAIGSFDKGSYFAAGTGGPLMLSILDNQIAKSNQICREDNLNRDQMKELVLGVLASASQRDIYTGDLAEVVLIENSGVNQWRIPLKLD